MVGSGTTLFFGRPSWTPFAFPLDRARENATIASEDHRSQTVTASRNTSENITRMRMFASHFAAANQATVGQPSNAALSLPGTYIKNTMVNAFVNNGAAYAYVALGGNTPPTQTLAEVIESQLTV